jgi:hypothetical protein
VELTAGEGIGAAGGAVSINAGESDTSAGNLSIEAGENNAAGNGGAATISGGTATVGTGGAAALIGGSVNSTGAGGNASTRGGDGSGTDQNGGYAYVQTGKSTGQGGSLVALQVSESEYSGSGSGSYVNAWSTYINANGNSGNKDVAINRHARFTDSADTTRGNIRLVAKSEPTGPSDGDVYNDSVTHQIGFYNGTRYHNLNPTVYNISDDAVTGQNPAALASTAYVLNEVPYGGVVGTTPLRHIIPANTLRVGSIIRVRAIMQLISLGGVSTFPTPKIYVGSIGAGPSPYTSPTGVQILAFSRASLAWDSCGVECELRVRSLGASGNVDLSWRATYDESSSVRPVHNQSIVNTSTLATNGALDVFAVALFGSSVGWQVDLTQFVVEIL